MDGIKKYTKEWFTLNGKENDFKDAKSIEGKSAVNTNTTLSRSVFEGTLDDAKTKLNKLKGESKGFPCPMGQQTDAYGLENIFNILDRDKDGIVTQEEIHDVASLYSEGDEQTDELLTTEDLDIFYENAMAAVNASFETIGNETKFTYENGTSLINTDENGNFVKIKETIQNPDGTTTVKDTNKNDEVIVSVYNADGKLISKDENYEGKLNDKTTSYNYKEDGTKTETIDTIGKNIVTEYDENGKIVDSQVKVKYNSDGIIGNTKQESINDCWVLAGVNALAFSEKGQEILNKAVTHNEDGSVTVNLVGGGKEYTFSAEEIALHQYTEGEKSFSSGDIDMNILEMAFAEYRKENIQNKEATIIPFDRAHNKSIGATEADPLNNGMTDEAIYLLTGTKAEYWLEPRIINVDKAGEKLLNKFKENPEDYAFVCSFKSKDSSIPNGEIVNSHVYSIKSVDDENVYVVNPWDSSKTITYPKDDFMKNVNDLSLTDLKEATTAKKLDSEKMGTKIQEKISHGLGKVDYVLRPKVNEGIDKAKDLYKDGKEFVEDTVDKAKDLYDDGKEFVGDKVDKAKSWWKKVKSNF